MTSSITDIKKAFGMPSSDSTHEYVFKSGEYGTLYQYWYRDRMGNYYRYTNAPVDHPDYDPFLGQPLLDPEQPLPEKNPEFFTAEGFKRNIAVPQNVEPQRNANYSQTSSRNIWFEVMKQKNQVQYVYLDADVKENLDLYVQNQLRVVDSAIPRFRQYATQLFTGTHIKDRITGALLMLVDQGFYEVEELVNSTVGDIEFVDQAVMFLGRKFVCDLNFFDFLTSLVTLRSPTEPLFEFDTTHGKRPVGRNYLYAVFASLRVSPKFLLYWNASHMFSRIVNRMSFQQVPADEVETKAFDELARALSTRDDVRYLVDFKLRDALLERYKDTSSLTEEELGKSLARLSTDDFGIAVIRSDLTSLREDEAEFSQWLHSEPMHDTSPEIEEMVEEELDASEEAVADEAQEGSADSAAGGEEPTEGGEATV